MDGKSFLEITLSTLTVIYCLFSKILRINFEPIVNHDKYSPPRTAINQSLNCKCFDHAAIFSLLSETIKHTHRGCVCASVSGARQRWRRRRPGGRAITPLKYCEVVMAGLSALVLLVYVACVRACACQPWKLNSCDSCSCDNTSSHDLAHSSFWSSVGQLPHTELVDVSPRVEAPVGVIPADDKLQSPDPFPS